VRWRYIRKVGDYIEVGTACDGCLDEAKQEIPAHGRLAAVPLQRFTKREEAQCRK
jgi:hypothetical protein